MFQEELSELSASISLPISLSCPFHPVAGSAPALTQGRGGGDTGSCRSNPSLDCSESKMKLHPDLLLLGCEQEWE